jgi:cytochrome c5
MQVLKEAPYSVVLLSMLAACGKKEETPAGKPVLYEQALKGFTGAKGTMPPKGASASLPDDDVKAAVDYMVSPVK